MSSLTVENANHPGVIDVVKHIADQHCSEAQKTHSLHGWSSLLAGIRCLLRMANLTSMTKMVSYRTLQGGAGGHWRTIDEVTDANVVRQAGSMNCGAACGEMLLRAQGVVVYQEVIADIAGAPSSAESLATALDGLDSSGTWFGGGVTESSFEALNQTGLWSAMLFEAGARFGHWVCVSGLDHVGRVMILDPADGTRYVMEIEEFMSHWTLFCVFRR